MDHLISLLRGCEDIKVEGLAEYGLGDDEKKKVTNEESSKESAAGRDGGGSLGQTLF